MWFRPCSHADAYNFHPRTKLVAGSTRDPKRQALFRDKHGKLPVYGNFREMLAQEGLEIVSIATPATCHAEMVLAAVEGGVKGIYCEKAMAVSLAECDAMLNSCERAGVKLAINHQRRWDDHFRAMKRLVDGGQIGALQSIQVSFGNGRLCRGGSHMFDLALFFAEDEVKRGCGWLSNPGEFDPGGTGLFETEKGIRILIDGATGMNHSFCMDLVGEKGLVRIVDGGFKFELWTKEEGSEFGQMVQRHLPLNYPVGNPILNAVDDLIESIEENREPASSGGDGRKAFEMIVAIHQSHRQGRRFVSLPLEERGLEVPSN
jgi:predicted dehydrogenase